MKDFRIASCQMDVVDDKNENIRHAVELIKEASNNNADIVCLPEMFNTPYDNDKFIENAEYEDDSITLEAMKTVADEESIILQCGSIAQAADDKIYNTAYLIDSNGKIIGKHQKMHLFDIDTNTMKFKESDTLTAGDNITTIKTDLATISLAICYDVRFPEYWTLLNNNQTDIVIMPGAFNRTTGPLHWQTLIRARAIDNQYYIVATSPSQVDNPYYIAWGHSMIVNPWGNILANANEKEEIIYSQINEKDKIEVREQIPVLTNKRRDIYETVLK